MNGATALKVLRAGPQDLFRYVSDAGFNVIGMELLADEVDAQAFFGFSPASLAAFLRPPNKVIMTSQISELQNEIFETVNVGSIPVERNKSNRS